MRNFGTAVFALALTANSWGQLVNASFEDPAIPFGTFTSGGIDGWSHFGTVGVWHPNQFSESVPDGQQIGYVNAGGTVAQVSSTLLVEGDNTVSFWVGRRLDGIEGQMLVDIWGGGFANGGQVVGGTAIGFDVIDAAEVAVGTFEKFSITRTLLAGDPLIGQAIGVRFAILSGSQVAFDHVEIQAVPEPMTLLALAAGLAAIRRRKRG